MLFDRSSAAPIAVVTGATGFLGRHVASSLVSMGIQVLSVSRQQGQGAVQVDDYRKTPGGDVLIHLAEEPDRAKVNRLGESYVEQAAAVVRELSRRFTYGMVYASSGAVYGDQNYTPCRVDMPVLGTDTYSRSKLINEAIVLDRGGSVVRLTNLFGVGMARTNVLSDVMRQVPGEGPVRIRDDKPVCDLLSVVDAATAFGLVVQNDFHGIVNVGSGVGTSVRSLVEFALHVRGQVSRQIVATMPSSRRSINVLDISKTREVIGWSPLDPVQRLKEFLEIRQEMQ